MVVRNQPARQISYTITNNLKRDFVTPFFKFFSKQDIIEENIIWKGTYIYMKKSFLWGIIAIIIVISGGGFIIHEENKQNAAPSSQTASSKTSSKKSSSQTSSDSSEDSSDSSSASSSSEDSSSQSQSSSSDTGTAGQQGEGKAGDHTVNGKTVSEDTIINVKDKIKSLGFNPNAWSPQDIIDLYRFCVNRGHSDPDQITRSDVQDYLNNGQ